MARNRRSPPRAPSIAYATAYANCLSERRLSSVRHASRRPTRRSLRAVSSIASVSRTPTGRGPATAVAALAETAAGDPGRRPRVIRRLSPMLRERPWARCEAHRPNHDAVRDRRGWASLRRAHQRQHARRLPSRELCSRAFYAWCSPNRTSPSRSSIRSCSSQPNLPAPLRPRARMGPTPDSGPWKPARPLIAASRLTAPMFPTRSAARSNRAQLHYEPQRLDRALRVRKFPSHVVRQHANIRRRASPPLEQLRASPHSNPSSVGIWTTVLELVFFTHRLRTPRARATSAAGR